MASQVAQWLRIYLPMQDLQDKWVQSLGLEDSQEEAHWTEKEKGIQKEELTAQDSMASKCRA